MDGVARYRPEHDVKLIRVVCLSKISPVSLSTISAECGRMTELKFAKHQEICATLSFVAFTGSEHLIGDALRIQRTPC